MNPRAEPLLWIQLLGLAVLPLEALLLLLVLGGSDPGPVPLVEQLLCWSLGGVAAALLLWRTPADVWSVLVAQIPGRGRRDLQQRLSRLQTTMPLKLLGPGLGAVALLPLLIRMDQLSAIAAPLWHPSHLPRLVALLLAALLLTVMLWQWQQVVQALWLLTRSPSVVEATPAMGLPEREESRLSLGIPLLLLSPLLFEAPKSASVESSGIDGPALPVEPEQPPADEEGTHLDEPIA
ncbi:MAG: low-complexity tail membrane protein [Cyanobium sp.]